MRQRFFFNIFLNFSGKNAQILQDEKENLAYKVAGVHEGVQKGTCSLLSASLVYILLVLLLLKSGYYAPISLSFAIFAAILYGNSGFKEVLFKERQFLYMSSL